MKRCHYLCCIPAFLGTGLSLCGQLPDELDETLLPASTGIQVGARQGTAVAIDGRIAVVGAFYDDQLRENDGAVRIYDAISGLLLHVIQTPDPTSDEQLGSSVAISGNRIAVGNGESSDHSARVYVYDLTSPEPTAPILTIEAPDDADGFGDPLAIDGNRLVVGAPAADAPYPGPRDVGAVFVYDLASPNPGEPAQRLDNPGAGTGFGFNVAVNGDGVAIAAYYSSSVWVYDLGAADPTVPAVEMTKPTAGYFGHSLAISGILLAIGAENENGNQGTFFLYNLTRPDPTIPILTVDNPIPVGNGYFAHAMAFDGTLLAVSAQRETISGEADAGRVFVFDSDSATPTTPVNVFDNPTPERADYYGDCVAISGDLVLVGAPYDDTAGSECGAAYVHDLSSVHPPSPRHTLNDTGPSTLTEMGAAVAISGRFLVAGVPSDDVDAENGGRVFIYDLEGADPNTPFLELPPPFPEEHACFGSAVAMEGRYVVVGVPFLEVSGHPNAGAAYLYDLLSGTPTVPIRTLTSPSPQDYDDFGLSLSMSGTRIAVGAPYYSDYGRVYVFDRTVPGGPIHTLSGGSSYNQHFGRSLAIDGGLLAVGDPYYGSTDYGRAYVFDLDGATPDTPLLTLINPLFDAGAPYEGTRFGASVAISGTHVIVGVEDYAYLFDTTAAVPDEPVETFTINTLFAGNDWRPTPGDYVAAISGPRVVIGVTGDYPRILTFDLDSGVPSQPVGELAPAVVELSDLYGFALAMDGPRLAAGVPWDDSAGANNGAVYIFDRSLTPEISLEIPGTVFVDGVSTFRLGLGAIGVPGTPQEITLRNVGGANLTDLAVSKLGGFSADFILDTIGMAATLGPAEATTFTVAFHPHGTSLRASTLRVASNDADENPFNLGLAGWSLSTADDTDGDGLNDVAEWEMTDLGFDWQVSQPALVATLQDNANAAGLYTAEQIGAVSFGGVIQENPLTGIFTLTIGVEKSDDFEIFDPFPMTELQTLINAAGELEFRFTVPDDTAFFQLEGH